MQQDDLALVVLAAGIGSRYGGMKQVDPIGPSGEIIIDYSVYDALRAGFQKVVFVISKAIEGAFRERVGRTIERRCDTAYVFQRLDDVPDGFAVPSARVKPWGTSHATWTSRTEVRGPFAVINADDYYGRTAFAAVAGYLREGIPAAQFSVQDYCLVGYRLGNTLTEHGFVARGVCTLDPAGYLVSARELTHIEQTGDGARYTEDGDHWSELPLETVVSMNMWGFTPAIFGDLAALFPRFLAANAGNIEKAEFFIPNAVADLIHAGRARAKVLPTSEKWYGVTYAADKPKVKEAIARMVRAGVYPAGLWGGEP